MLVNNLHSTCIYLLASFIFCSHYVRADEVICEELSSSYASVESNKIDDDFTNIEILVPKRVEGFEFKYFRASFRKSKDLNNAPSYGFEAKLGHEIDDGVVATSFNLMGENYTRVKAVYIGQECVSYIAIDVFNELRNKKKKGRKAESGL